MLVFLLIVCLVLALAVLGLVAVPARRAGRDVLTARGEEVFVKVRTGTESAANATSNLVTSAAGRMRSGSSAG